MSDTPPEIRELEYRLRARVSIWRLTYGVASTLPGALKQAGENQELERELWKMKRNM